MTINAGPNRWVLPVVVVACCLLGWAKLERQRSHPPDWARKPIHLYDGYVSIDGFAQRAELVRAVLRGEDPDARRLSESLRTELHPNSLVVPLLVGALAVPLGSIPLAFALVNLALFLACLLLVRRVARLTLEALGVEWARERSTWAVLVFAAHVDTCRNVLQFHLDFSVTFLALAAVAVALEAFSGEQRLRNFGWLAGLNLLGAFSKASFAPCLAVGPLAAIPAPGPRRAGKLGLAALSAGLPIACLIAYSSALGAGGSVWRDVEHFRDSGRIGPAQLGRFLMELLLALQWLPLVTLLQSSRAQRAVRFVLICSALYLVSLLAFGLPSVPRLFLPAIALLSSLCVPFLLGLEQRFGRWPVHAWVGLNLTLALAGLRWGG